MENKVIWFATPNNTAPTKNVFYKDQQVFTKSENQESGLPENHGEVWYPINFQWIPVLNLSESLKQ